MYVIKAYPTASAKAPVVATCQTRSYTLANATRSLWIEDGFHVVLWTEATDALDSPTTERAQSQDR